MKISEGTNKTLQYVYKTKIYKFYSFVKSSPEEKRHYSMFFFKKQKYINFTVLSKVALSILSFNTLHVHVFI